jgi:pyruvate-ferredoxin/flavodoxin oxidoreductase
LTARESGMGGRINTIMQVCFFALSGVLPKDEAIEAIKDSIRKTYDKKGEDVVLMNLNAVDRTLERLYEVQVPELADGGIELSPPVPASAPPFVREVLGEIIAGRGNELPVSALPCDGVYPTGTARWEKRNLALEIPVWDPAACIQCGKCAMFSKRQLTGTSNGFDC